MKPHTTLLVLLFLTSLLMWIAFIGDKDFITGAVAFVISTMFIHEYKQRNI